MDHDFQYILGEDAPYLLVARYDAWYEFKENKMFAFVPGTLQIASHWSLALDNNERLEVALAGGGVRFTAPAYWHSLQFAPALSGSWYQAPTPPAAPLTGPSLQVSSSSVSDATEWAYGQGSARGGRIGRYTHQTTDAAAFASIREHMPNSVVAGREFGGSICRTPANRYFGGTPNVGDSGEVEPSPCPAGNTRTGEYHTHVGLAPLDGFSHDDMYRAYIGAISAYVGVRVDLSDRTIDCRSKGQGNIWKYTPDLTRPWNALSPPFIVWDDAACTPVK
jgi:hypothetical protein